MIDMHTLRYLLVAIIIGALCSCISSQDSCASAPSQPGDRRLDKSKLTIASFNVEWLFLNRSNCPGSGCAWPDLAVAKIHFNNIANVLVDLDADIVVMPETDSCTILIELLRTSTLPSKGYKPYLIKGTDTATGQNVGLITRVDPTTALKRVETRVSYPVAGHKCGSSSSSGTTAVSKHFYTELNVAGISNPIVLIGLHFLAFPTTVDRCIQREAQATVIRTIIESVGLDQNKHVVVLGDFNDYDNLIIDAGGNVPTSRALSIIKGSELSHVLSRYTVQASDIYTSWYDKNSNCIDEAGGEHSMIDHILVSNKLASLIKKVRFYRGWKASCTTYFSDHWPLLVDLDTSQSAQNILNQVTGTTIGNESDNPSNAGPALGIVLAVVIVVAVLLSAAFVLYRKYKSNQNFQLLL